MLNQYSRLEFVLGPDALATLRTKRVAIFGMALAAVWWRHLHGAASERWIS